MTIRESGTSSQTIWNFTYNSNRQITQMKSTNATSTGTYDLFYLDNGNLDYINQQFTGSPSSTISLKYDSGLRLIQLSTNGTPEVNFAHSVGNNIYTATLLSSSESFDIDFDENNNLQGYYSGTDSVVISYLSDQPGVFANVTLNPSVIIPFHILPYSYEIY